MILYFVSRSRAVGSQNRFHAHVPHAMAHRKVTREDLRAGLKVHYKGQASSDFIITKVEDPNIFEEGGNQFVRLRDKHQAMLSRIFVFDRDVAA